MLMLQIVIRCSIVSAADRVAGVLEDVAGPAADPDPGDQREDDVLGADAGREPAVDPDLVGLRSALEQRLGREDHLDLARPDPERERPERAVGRGVRVAADDRHPGLGQAQLGADDVDDALARRAEAVERDAELRAVARQLVDLGRGHRVGDRQGARVGRRRVVGGRDGPLRVADRQAAGAEARERLRRGDLVDEMEVDREDGRRARLLDDDVVVPDLLDDRARRSGDSGLVHGHGRLAQVRIRQAGSRAGRRGLGRAGQGLGRLQAGTGRRPRGGPAVGGCMIIEPPRRLREPPGSAGHVRETDPWVCSMAAIDATSPSRFVADGRRVQMPLNDTGLSDGSLLGLLRSLVVGLESLLGLLITGSRRENGGTRRNGR